MSLVVGLEGALLQGGLSFVPGVLPLFLGDLIGESDSFLLGELLLVVGLELVSDIVTNTNKASLG